MCALKNIRKTRDDKRVTATGGWPLDRHQQKKEEVGDECLVVLYLGEYRASEMGFFWSEEEAERGVEVGIRES